MQKDYAAAANNKAQFNVKAQNLYLDALRHFLNKDEANTALALNDARKTVLNGRHWMTCADTDLQKIMPDLDGRKFDSLYGDYKSNAGTVWNTGRDVLDMVRRHIDRLGNEDDRGNFRRFARQNAPAMQSRLALSAL